MAVTSKIASAQQPLPLGWAYSYLNDGFTGPNGEFISRDMVRVHGSFDKAFAHMYGPADPQGNITYGTNTTLPPPGSYAVSSASSIQPASLLSFETDHGRVSLNIKTGELTLPQGMAKEDSIREFWLGFQKYFKTTDTMVLETRIKELQLDVARAQATAALMKKEDEKEVSKKIAEKVAKKYGGEKFIMVKPEDLIRFIQEA